MTLSSCTYLEACINEALRMAPPVPGVLPRTVVGDHELIDGLLIPRGTTVGSCAYSVHHNEEYIPKPYNYTPERWLKEHSSTTAIRQLRSVFVPFSIGPRSCAGRTLAMLELSLAIATVVWQFDIQTPVPLSDNDNQPKANVYHLFDHMNASKTGPILQFRKRLV
jgi:cytochrome P450